MRTAVEEIRRINLDVSFGKSSKKLGWTSLDAWRERHGAFTASIAPLAEHMLVGYFNQPVAAQRTIDGIQQRAYVGAGMLSLIPAGYANETRITAPVDVVHVYIPAASISDTARSLGVRSDFAMQPRLGFEDEVGSHLFRLLALQLGTGESADDLFAEHLSELINAHLLRGHSNASLSKPKGGLAPWQLKRVQGYLHEHLDQPVTLAALVQRSRSHFISAFRQSTGATPHAYLLALRVARAKALLIERPDQPVCDIALTCGFSSQSHLTDAFRKLTGTTPTNYRRLN